MLKKQLLCETTNLKEDWTQRKGLDFYFKKKKKEKGKL